MLLSWNILHKLQLFIYYQKSTYHLTAFRLQVWVSSLSPTSSYWRHMQNKSLFHAWSAGSSRRLDSCCGSFWSILLPLWVCPSCLMPNPFTLTLSKYHTILRPVIADYLQMPAARLFCSAEHWCNVLHFFLVLTATRVKISILTRYRILYVISGFSSSPIWSLVHTNIFVSEVCGFTAVQESKMAPIRRR